MTSSSTKKEYKHDLNRSTILAFVCKLTCRSHAFYKNWSTDSLYQRLEADDYNYELEIRNF